MQVTSAHSRMDAIDLEGKSRQLAKTAKTVEAHIRAHRSVGSGITGPANIQTTTSPDGKSYVASGDVPINTSIISDNPDIRLLKAKAIQRVALTPSDPSAIDRQVAQIGQQIVSETLIEKNKSTEASDEREPNYVDIDSTFEDNLGQLLDITI